MATDSPFLFSKVECPICKTVNEFETIRVGAYVEAGRDTDFCPTNVKWRFPRYDGYHPLVYFIATCSNCYYSRELTNNFKDWKNDNTFRTYRLKSVKEAHLEQLSINDSVVRQMGDAINVSRYPNESAILKLLLAIYDEQLPERRSTLDLGRFYLRVAWLFREMEKNENPTRKLLNGLMHELGRKYTEVHETIGKMRAKLESFSGHVSEHFDSGQLPPEIRTETLPFRDRYETVIASANGFSTELEAAIKQVSVLNDEYRQSLLGGEPEEGGRSFAGHASFQDFLAEMKRSWMDIPITEREALERAVHHYREAFANGRDIAPGNQHIQAAYLIAELSRRIGEHEQAKEFFRSTIKSGQEFIHKHRDDTSRTALARKILELAIEQGRLNLQEAQKA